MTSEERDRTIRSTLSAVLGVRPADITDETSPDNVGSWDSVTHLNLVLALEEAFGVSFTPEETMDLTSVRLIHLLLAEKGT